MSFSIHILFDLIKNSWTILTKTIHMNLIGSIETIYILMSILSYVLISSSSIYLLSSKHNKEI